MYLTQFTNHHWLRLVAAFSLLHACTGDPVALSVKRQASQQHKPSVSSKETVVLEVPYFDEELQRLSELPGLLGGGQCSCSASEPPEAHRAKKPVRKPATPTRKVT
ncbi:MAG: hypothetical protein AAFP93_02440, partial [Bacteroidota bacterium]